MADIVACLTGQPATITLGSVVSCQGHFGAVWHVTRDTLRVVPLVRGRVSLALPLASEVALHLPVSLGGWSIDCNELASWPRPHCNVIGELDERCLLRLLEARNRASVPHLAFTTASIPELAGQAAHN